MADMTEQTATCECNEKHPINSDTFCRREKGHFGVHSAPCDENHPLGLSTIEWLVVPLAHGQAQGVLWEQLDAALAPLSIEHRIFVKSRFLKLEAEITTLRTQLTAKEEDKTHLLSVIAVLRERLPDAERKGWNAAIEVARMWLNTADYDNYNAIHALMKLDTSHTSAKKGE